MARSVDPTKLEKIKEATISMIVEKGYGGASISAIAAKAGVADGYLYRHYPSKTELVRDLFNESITVYVEHIRKELENYKDITSFITRYHLGLVDIINENPDKTKFFIQLINDFTFTIDKDAKQLVRDLCTQILEQGRKNNDVSESCTLIDIYIIVVIIPLQLFSLYLKEFFETFLLDASSASLVTQTCLKIIKK